MTDMLVKLYELPPLQPVLQEQEAAGRIVRRVSAPEKHIVVNWVKELFSEGWASECDVSFSNHPPSCFITIEERQLTGFACYDATAKNFFGPTGVSPEHRGKGIGKALLLACLHSMYADGYGYAIIGGVGPIEFYKHIVRAIEIPDSAPGIYQDLL